MSTIDSPQGGTDKPVYKRLEHDKIINELMSVLKTNPDGLPEEQRVQLKTLLEGKNEVEYLSKEEQAALDVLSGVKKGRGRLWALFGMGIAGAAIALAVSQKGDDQETKADKKLKDAPGIAKVVPDPMSEPPPPEGLEVPQMPPMPEVEFVNMPVQHMRPNGIECSQEEYIQAATAFVYEVQNVLIPKLIRSFDMRPEFKAPTAQREQIFVHFMIEAVETAARNPLFKPYIDQKKDNEDMKVWADHIKPLFLAGGCYFDFGRNVVTYDPEANAIVPTTKLNMYVINGDEMLAIKDHTGTTGAKILHLGDRLFDLDESKIIGLYDQQEDMGLIFENNLDAKSKIDALIKSGVIKERPENEAQVIEHYRRNSIIHEATHVLLGKSVMLGKSADAFQTFKVPFTIPLNDAGIYGDISGIYTPVHFSELCAVGNEIYHDQSDFPLIYAMYFSDHQNSFGYEFVDQVLPLLTVRALPESPEKDALLAKLQSSHKLGSIDVARMAIHQLTPEMRKQVGMQMYNMGRQAFFLAETGQLESGNGNY